MVNCAVPARLASSDPCSWWPEGWGAQQKAWYPLAAAIVTSPLWNGPVFMTVLIGGGHELLTIWKNLHFYLKRMTYSFYWIKWSIIRPVLFQQNGTVSVFTVEYLWQLKWQTNKEGSYLTPYGTILWRHLFKYLTPENVLAMNRQTACTPLKQLDATQHHLCVSQECWIQPGI